MTTVTSDPVHFLIVDDLRENLLALEALLRREGLVVLEATSGAAALELLLKHEVALALVDVQMPGMDGFELAELMRGTERTRRVPIIFLTAGSEDRQRRFRGYEAGAVDFIRKPIESDILRSKADVFFELYRQRQEVAQQRDELKLATEQNARLLHESQLQAEALRKADQRKDEFLAMLAHELRNPLAPIRNAVEILRLDERPNPDAKYARDIISRQVTHMVRLIDDLLDVARIARGKVQLRRESCDLTAIVRQTAEDYRPTLVAAGLNLELEVSGQALNVFGDPIRLAQIVGNLLHNAGKFTPRNGSVHVEVIGDERIDAAVVRVSDTGAGLDAATLAQMFEPFHQANQSFDRSKGGLGLGLALAKGLIELHGGSISADSDGLGHGATFALTVPLARGTTGPGSHSTSTASASLGGLRILVVEDNRDSAESLRILLTLLGHEVTAVFDGVAGLIAAAKLQPDVVLSDLGLPGDTDGYSLARLLRNKTELAPLHLISLSGWGQDDDRRRAITAGFDQHLVKPVDPAALSKALAEVSRRSTPVAS